MSRFILIVFFFLCTTIASAQTQNISEAKKAEVATLANQICDTMMLYKNFRKPTYVAFEKMVLKYLKKETEKGAEKTFGISSEVAAFWQQYHPYFICTTAHHGYTTPQHVLKRLVDMNDMTGFYFDYFLQDESVNLNAIEWVAGEPETLIDYLDKILADPQNKELYHLETVRQSRSLIVGRVNAKRACEMLEEYDCKARYDELIENAPIDSSRNPCYAMALATQNNESVILAFESSILRILDIPAENNEYHDAVISKFWNKYGDRFNCEDPRHSQAP